MAVCFHGKSYLLPPVKKLCTIIATGFGLGYSPVASGTVGSLWGVLIVWGVAVSGMHWGWQIALCVVLSLLCLPVCDVAEKVLGKKDDGRIVADEYLTFPICMIGLPWWKDHLWLLPVGFVVCRLMDIVKPFPAHRLQDLHGGLGITIDDVIASLYALAINWGIYSLWGFLK